MDLDEYLKKINSILSWFNELSKKLDFKYWLDLTTLSKIYYNNNLDNIRNIYISLESKYLSTLFSYFIQNKIQFKSSKDFFSKINYLQYDQINSYIEIEELTIYFWKKDDINLINDKLGLKVFNETIYELKTITYNEEEYSVPNQIEKYLEIINLKEKDINENKLINKFNNILLKKRNEISKNEISKNEISKNEIPKNEIPKNEIPKNEIAKNEIAKNEIPKNEKINFLIKEETKLEKILKKRDNYWEKYEKSLKNQREIEDLNIAKNIDRKNQMIPKFFSL